MGRRDHCLECAWCAESLGVEGEPCFQCERTGRLLTVAMVWRKACRDFVPVRAPFEPPVPAASER